MFSNVTRNKTYRLYIDICLLGCVHALIVLEFHCRISLLLIWVDTMASYRVLNVLVLNALAGKFHLEVLMLIYSDPSLFFLECQCRIIWQQCNSEGNSQTDIRLTESYSCFAIRRRYYTFSVIHLYIYVHARYWLCWYGGIWCRYSTCIKIDTK